MARIWLAMFSLSLPLACMGADDHRISFLEQEVRNLQRQVQALTRLVEESQRRTSHATPSSAVAPPESSDELRSGDSHQWLDTGKWRALKPGMGELEVIRSLGPPTSMREQDDARVLLYAMEIGASGFLGGSVTLRNRIVVEVQVPMLK